MTGFSRARSDGDTHEVVVELRSVNHRYLDTKMKAPAALAFLDKQVRDRVGAKVTRGKVDITINLKPKGDSTHEIEVDEPLMKEFVRVANRLRERTGVQTPLTLTDLLSFTPAFSVREKEVTDSGVLWDAVEPPLGEALDKLTEMREAEGREMAADLSRRIDVLSLEVNEVERLSDAKRESKRSELEASVTELIGSNVEPAVIAMEVSRLVERGDIAEEITRFRAHLEMWRSTVEKNEPCGKKLDFIVQEMNREVNTIGSKSQDAEIAERVITMKSEIERIREQVQNIE